MRAADDDKVGRDDAELRSAARQLAKLMPIHDTEPAHSCRAGVVRSGRPRSPLQFNIFSNDDVYAKPRDDSSPEYDGERSDWGGCDDGVFHSADDEVSFVTGFARHVHAAGGTATPQSDYFDGAPQIGSVTLPAPPILLVLPQGAARDVYSATPQDSLPGVTLQAARRGGLGCLLALCASTLLALGPEEVGSSGLCVICHAGRLLGGR